MFRRATLCFAADTATMARTSSETFGSERGRPLGNLDADGDDSLERRNTAGEYRGRGWSCCGAMVRDKSKLSDSGWWE